MNFESVRFIVQLHDIGRLIGSRDTARTNSGRSAGGHLEAGSSQQATDRFQMAHFRHDPSLADATPYTYPKHELLTRT